MHLETSKGTDQVQHISQMLGNVLTSKGFASFGLLDRTLDVPKCTKFSRLSEENNCLFSSKLSLQRGELRYRTGRGGRGERNVKLRFTLNYINFLDIAMNDIPDILTNRIVHAICSTVTYTVRHGFSGGLAIACYMVIDLIRQCGEFLCKLELVDPTGLLIK